MPAEATRNTLLVTQTLERLHIPYAVGGSLASSLHGVMRSTLGVDIVADMNLEHIPLLAAELSKEFYADEEMMRGAVEHRSSFNLIHYETAFKVDIFIPRPRAFDQMQLERRRRSIISTDPEESIYIASGATSSASSKRGRASSIWIIYEHGRLISKSPICWNALWRN
ncbi:MAG TPA: hypothetical protein VFY26_00865 [Anaerolineales bacterium]|nr:hypothetical protein [Anaerolineales bacterium]